MGASQQATELRELDDAETANVLPGGPPEASSLTPYQPMFDSDHREPAQQQKEASCVEAPSEITTPPRNGDTCDHPGIVSSK